MAAPAAGFAADDKKEAPAVSTLEEVVVTAGRVEERRKEVTANITVIGAEEIKRSQARDIGELLAEKSIGHIQKYPGASTSIGIRGFRTETHGNDLKGHVLILLNGRRAGTGNLAKILTKNVERVEIIRGPASVQYGSAAMGGIVNVITLEGTGSPGFFAEGGFGSFGFDEWSLGTAGALGRVDFSGSFTRQTKDDYQTATGDTYFNTGFDNKTSANMNLGFEFAPGNRIGVIYNGFVADEVGNPGYFSQNDRDDYKDTVNSSVDFIYDGVSRNTMFSWQARYFDGRDADKWFDPSASDPSGFWDDDIPFSKKTFHQGAQAQVSLNRQHFRITAGYDWLNYDERSTPYAPQQSEYDNRAAFVLGNVRLLDTRLVLTGGLRYDRYEVEVQEPAGRTEDDNNVTPQAGIAYMLVDGLRLRANYGEAFVMPAADQLAADFIVSGTHYLGNPDLKPEESRTYEWGVDVSKGSLNGSLTYFDTDFKNKIEDVSKPGNVQTWENIGTASMAGVEGDVSYDLGALFGWDYELRPHVSFVYLDKFDDEEQDKRLQYISDLHVTYGVAFSDYAGLTIDLNIIYTGEQYINDFESGLWPAPEIKKGGFTVANLTISKSLLDFTKGGRLSLKGEINNLFDRDYEYVQGYPMQGRNFFLGLRYDY